MRLPTLIGLLVAGLLSISFAHAQDLTAQQKFDALAAKGIFAGQGGTQASQDQDMTRAEFARVAALLLGLDGVSTTPTTVTFQDMSSGGWAAAEVQGVKAAGMLAGDAGNSFQSGADVTMEQLARILAETLGLDVDPDAQVPGASNWAQGYIAAALEAGLLPPTSDYTQAATRGDLVTAAFNAQERAQPGTLSVSAGTGVPGGRAGMPDLSGALTFINQQTVPLPTMPVIPQTISNLDQAVGALLPASGSGLGGATGVIPPGQLALDGNNPGNDIMLEELLKQAIGQQNNGTLTGFYAGGFTGDGGTVGGTIQLNAELGGGSGAFDGWMDFETGSSGRAALAGLGVDLSGNIVSSGPSPAPGVQIGGVGISEVGISGQFAGSSVVGGEWYWEGSSTSGIGTFDATYQ